MSKITTEDCKEFLVSHYKSQGAVTLTKDWKRVSKYKVNEQWNRDFDHPAFGTVVVCETDDKLFIVNTASVALKPVKTLSTPAAVVQKQFSLEDKEGAKELIKLYTFYDQNDENYHDNLKDSDQWGEFFHALPSQFLFSFPEAYHNYELENAPQGIDSPMEFKNEKDKGSFCVIFEDKNGSDPDLYASEMMANGLLPIWTGFVDEYNLEVDNGPKGLTIRQFFTMLVNMGLEYDPTDCVFKDELTKIKIEMGIITEDLKDISLKEGALLKQIIKADDDIKLSEMIAKGLDINRFIPGKKRVLFEAVVGGALKCSQILLDKGASLWINNHEAKNYSEDNSVVSDIVQRDNQRTFLPICAPYTLKEKTENAVKKWSNVIIAASSHYKGREMEKVYNLASDMLKPEEVNQAFLNCSYYLVGKNPGLLKKVAQQSSDKSIEKTIVENIYHLETVAWILQNHPVDLSHTKIGEQTVKEHITDKITFAQETVDKGSKSGFQVVFDYGNGNSVSQLQIDKLHLALLHKILYAINGNSSNRFKM